MKPRQKEKSHQTTLLLAAVLAARLDACMSDRFIWSATKVALARIDAVQRLFRNGCQREEKPKKLHQLVLFVLRWTGYILEKRGTLVRVVQPVIQRVFIIWELAVAGDWSLGFNFCDEVVRRYWPKEVEFTHVLSWPRVVLCI